MSTYAIPELVKALDLWPPPAMLRRVLARVEDAEKQGLPEEEVYERCGIGAGKTTFMLVHALQTVLRDPEAHINVQVMSRKHVLGTIQQLTLWAQKLAHPEVMARIHVSPPTSSPYNFVFRDPSLNGVRSE